MLTVLTHLNLEGLEEQVREVVPDAEVIPIAPDQKLPANLRGDVLLTPGIGADNLASLLGGDHGIRWVHAFSTGVDSFPVPLIGERLFSCSRGASAVPIAEWVMAMMLTVEKRLPEAWIEQPPQIWHLTFPLESLQGKRLAIVGFGAIGQAVARRALPFGMAVRTMVRHPRSLPIPEVELVKDIRELVRDADHILLSAPATDATRHIVNAEVLSAMKPSAHLINIARGSLVDEVALKTALDEGQIALASLDAVMEEPLSEGHWMYAHPRVRLSPHVSWIDPRGLDRLLQGFLDNLAAFVNDEALPGAVDTVEGY